MIAARVLERIVTKGKVISDRVPKVLLKPFIPVACAFIFCLVAWLTMCNCLEVQEKVLLVRVAIGL